MTRPSRSVGALLLAGLAAGCAGEVDDPSAPSPTGATAPTTAEEPSVPDTTAEPPRGIDTQVDVAVGKLAARLDVSEDEIEVVSAEAVTWGDASLGCPQPGMRYAQVVTEGVLIVLAHGGVEYPFHAGDGRPDPFLCEDPRQPVG